MCLDRVCWFLAFQSHPHAEPLADWLRLPLSSSQPSRRFSSRIATLMKKLGHWNVLTPFACHVGLALLRDVRSIETEPQREHHAVKQDPPWQANQCQHVPLSKFPVPSQAFTERFGATRILVGGHCRLHGREHVVHTGSSVFCSQLCFCTHVQPLGALASMDCVGWSSIFCRCQHAVHDENNAAVRSLIYGHDLPRVKHCVQQLECSYYSPGDGRSTVVEIFGLPWMRRGHDGGPLHPCLGGRNSLSKQRIGWWSATHPFHRRRTWTWRQRIWWRTCSNMVRPRNSFGPIFIVILLVVMLESPRCRRLTRQRKIARRRGAVRGVWRCQLLKSMPSWLVGTLESKGQSFPVYFKISREIWCSMTSIFFSVFTRWLRTDTLAQKKLQAAGRETATSQTHFQQETSLSALTLVWHVRHIP